MAFENKGQRIFSAKEAYGIIGGYNKMLREKGLSDEKQIQEQKTQTAPKQSGFGKF